MNGKLIIVDGISNAGKTTLCTTLSNDGVVLIDEVPKFIEINCEKYGLKLSSTMPQTIEEEKYNQQILFRAEIDRLKMAADIIKSGSSAVLDRSFLSTVAIAYAFDSQNPFKGSYDNARELLKEYIKQIVELFKEENVLVFFLDVDKDKIQERNISRNKPLTEDWIDNGFLDKQRNFFKAISSVIRCQMINTSDLETSEIYDIISQKMGGKKK